MGNTNSSVEGQASGRLGQTKGVRRNEAQGRMHGLDKMLQGGTTGSLDGGGIGLGWGRLTRVEKTLLLDWV